jgi:hypothetical protein
MEDSRAQRKMVNEKKPEVKNLVALSLESHLLYQ